MEASHLPYTNSQRRLDTDPFFYITCTLSLLRTILPPLVTSLSVFLSSCLSCVICQVQEMNTPTSILILIHLLFLLRILHVRYLTVLYFFKAPSLSVGVSVCMYVCRLGLITVSIFESGGVYLLRVLCCAL